VQESAEIIVGPGHIRILGGDSTLPGREHGCGLSSPGFLTGPPWLRPRITSARNSTRHSRGSGQPG
jgi:hypothetical protein